MVPELRAMISKKASAMSFSLLNGSSGSTHQMNVRAAKKGCSRVAYDDEPLKRRTLALITPPCLRADWLFIGNRERVINLILQVHIGAPCRSEEDAAECWQS